MAVKYEYCNKCGEQTAHSMEGECVSPKHNTKKKIVNQELNIPIYRAKKIDSDEYVEGYLYEAQRRYFVLLGIFQTINEPFKRGVDGIKSECYEIDPSTLAIHFTDMKDSEGTKIFASLSEDDKGGSSVSFDGTEIGYIFFKDGKYQINDLEDGEISNLETYSSELKVTGIQQ